MAAQVIRRLANSRLPMVGLIGVLLLSLYFLGASPESLERFGRFYIWLLGLNAVGLAFIAVLIGMNTWNLISQFRRRAAGSRLTAKLVVMFVILTLVPVTIVYSFSVRFLRSGIDSWFDVRVELALEKALELSRDSLGAHMRTLQRLTQNMGPLLGDLSADMAVTELNDLRMDSGAAELTLMSGNRMLATSGGDEINVIPDLPDQAILGQVRRGEPYVGLDPVNDNGLYIRVVVPILTPDPREEGRVLQALYPIAERINSLADDVQGEFQKYRQLTYLREPLKVSFVLTLSLVLLLSVLTAVWAAFQAARRLMLPIHDLAEGTQAVAEGDYSTRLAASGRDELGFLVRSFNDMTLRLALARDETHSSQRQVESQRAYLEAVLARISTGVLTLDKAQVLHTANAAASNILGVELAQHLGQSLQDLHQAYPVLQQLFDTVSAQLQANASEWSAEVELFGRTGRRLLVCRGTALPGLDGEASQGHVLVFDDVTAMIRAQREAAWSEVARRLAHEIKNPLTPIQLSAERLRQKYLDKMPADDAEVLDRLTRTIVQQVEAMKAMVNAFAEYASTPEARFEEVDVNALIKDVAELYQGNSQLCLLLDLEPTLPRLKADLSRLRQLLHNLLKNALEAQREKASAEISVSTRVVNDQHGQRLELVVSDAGPGIRPELLEKLFEPYVTTKTKGSGLGLAVVKKIVEEHNGVIRATNRDVGGACMTVQIPLLDKLQQTGRGLGLDRNQTRLGRESQVL